MPAVVARLVAWGLVGGGAAILGLVLDRSSIGSDSAAGLAVGFGLMAGLGVEAGLLVARQLREANQPPEPPAGARPADGLVHVWTMGDVERGEPLAGTRWRRFEALGPGNPGATNPPRAPVRDLPQPQPLLGQVALISVFVGRDGRSWTTTEIRAAHQSLATAGRWIGREALRWGACLNIGLADTFFQADAPDAEPVEIGFVPEGDDFGPMEADATTRAVATASRVAARLGFADVADLVTRINPTIRADGHVWLWHFKQRGRSHAIPVGDRVVRGVGLAICYARESSWPEPLLGPARVDPVTVTHELFHLFGGSDKYGTRLASFPPGTVSRREIMRLDEVPFDRMRVDWLTAREVGWPVGSPPEGQPQTVRNGKPAPRQLRRTGDEG